MPELPTGTVTLLFTDIEGSTTRWEQHRTAQQAAVARHNAILRLLWLSRSCAHLPVFPSEDRVSTALVQKVTLRSFVTNELVTRLTVRCAAAESTHVYSAVDGT